MCGISGRYIKSNIGPGNYTTSKYYPVQAMLKVIPDFDAVVSKIFDSHDYLKAVHSLGYSVLFYGIDLEHVVDSTSDFVQCRKKSSQDVTRTSAYIALDLFIPISPMNAFGADSRDPPYLRLLLRCLKGPWEWSSEGKHAVYLKCSNIELNISIYRHNDGLEDGLVGNCRLVVEHVASEDDSDTAIRDSDGESDRIIGDSDGDSDGESDTTDRDCNANKRFEADIAICCGDLGADVSFEHRVGTPFGIHTLYIKRNCAEQRSCRKFKLDPHVGIRWHVRDGCLEYDEIAAGDCDCELEERLRGVDPSDEMTFQKVKSVYTQPFFRKSKGQHANTIGSEGTSASTAGKFNSLLENAGVDLQLMVIDKLDDLTYTNMAMLSSPSSLLRYNDARRRHAVTWRTVIRNDDDFSTLLKLAKPGKDAFLAGLGVQALYNANSRVHDKQLGVILSSASEIDERFVNWNKFTRSRVGHCTYTTLSNPSIQLYLGTRNDSKLLVKNIEDFIHRTGPKRKLTIPILYLKGGKHFLDEARVKIIQTSVLDCYYSFSVQGKKFRMEEER